MIIPNTTPTPNELYNGEMKKMNDTELRVVLVVTRATLGWEVNNETGMRKQEDWISRSQLVEKTGRSSRAVSQSIDQCIKRGWVEARTKEGALLDSAEKRKKHGARIYYRLGRIFLDKIETIEETTMVNKPSQLTTPTIATNDIQPWQKGNTTKETLTKENIQNNTEVLQAKPVTYGNNDINFLTSYLKEKLALPMLDGTNKKNRWYCQLLLKKFGGVNKIRLLIDAASVDKFWSTKITSFSQLYYKGVQIMSDTRKKGGVYDATNIG